MPSAPQAPHFHFLMDALHFRTGVLFGDRRQDIAAVEGVQESKGKCVSLRSDEREEMNNKMMPTRRPFSSKFWTLLQQYVTTNISKGVLQSRLAVELFYFFDC
jgi:hypothetical protein